MITSKKFSLKRQPLKLLIIFATIASSLVILPSANAGKGYRYWGYFQAPAGSTNWTAAMTGPSVPLHDGDVEGWSFTASSNDIPATAPMADPDFASLCGNTSAVAGKIRVGIVIDFGPAEIAPAGENPKEVITDCVTIPTKSTGLKALEAITTVRADKSGLICGIGGYPTNECGVEIDMPTAQSTSTNANADETNSQESNSEETNNEKQPEFREGFELTEYLSISIALIAAVGIFVIVRRRKKS